jgi:hypothetical protein
VLLVFFSFVILLIATMGIYITRQKSMGYCTLIIFGLISFFLGFIPPIVEGGSMLALSRVEPGTI